MSICKEIIDSTLKSYTPASFESLDMSEVIDIEERFTVCCEGFIESLLDSALDSSREAINRKAQERINYFFEAVENDFIDREEIMKRLTVCYGLIAGQGSSLMGWKRFMINHKHDTLKEANEIYFKNWQGKAAISCK